MRYRVGATSGPIVGGLVQRLAAAHPGHQVSVHAAWSIAEITEKVLAAELDFALIGTCSTGSPAGADMVWRAVSVDPVWVLISDRHPLAGRAQVALADLAGEPWVSAPGDSCFNDCFAAACAREGFTPRSLREMDTASCFDLVAAGSAVVLCQGPVRQIPGAVAMPLAGQPLSWRHLLGWDRNSVAARFAADVHDFAVCSYLDIIRQRPRYADWLTTHVGFGARR
jgi:hypothetical protein